MLRGIIEIAADAALGEVAALYNINRLHRRGLGTGERGGRVH